MKSRMFVILFLAIALLVIIVNSQSELVDGGSDGIVSDECELKCEIHHQHTIEFIKKYYNEQIHECNNERKRALNICKQLIGRDRKNCVKQSIINSQQCKKNANIAEKSRIRDVNDNLNECLNLCRGLNI